MIVDLHELKDTKRIDADICIIGAGAAGLAMAREFKDYGGRVCILAGGGVDIDPDAQDLYETTIAEGSPEYNNAICRFRQIGGSAAHWVGRCARLAEGDFQKRDWIEASGWPIGLHDMLPYYERSERFLQLAPVGFGPQAGEVAHYPQSHVDSRKLEPIYFQIAAELGNAFAYFNPATAYGQEFEASPSLQVLLNAHATHIQMTEAGERVSHIKARTLEPVDEGGLEVDIHARLFVVACGGIENARMLLSADDVMMNGIGNGHGLVGRYFQEHARGDAAQLISDRPEEVADLLNLPHDIDGHRFLPGMMLAPEMIQREQILSSGVLVNVDFDYHTATDALKKIFNDARHLSFKADFDDNLLHVLRDLDDVAWNVGRRLFQSKPPMRPIRRIMIETETEHAPNPSSRVYLTGDRDAMGMRQLEINLAYGEVDKRTVQVMMNTLAGEFGRLGLGRLKLEPWMEDPTILNAPDRHSCHHMGTTRMGNNPSSSVVDSHCKVHGVPNLYMAGASVFTTSGYVNPTNTLIALAIRLADHIKAKDAKTHAAHSPEELDATTSLQ